MKNIFYALLVLIIWTALVWFGRGWWDGRNMQEAGERIQETVESADDSLGSTITHTQIDTFFQTDTLWLKGDPVPYIPDGYVLKSSVTDFAVEKQIDRLKYTFTGQMDAFTINGVTGYPFTYKITVWSKAEVDMDPPLFYPNKDFFNDLIYSGFEQGWKANSFHGKQKLGYYGAGILSAVIVYLIVK